MEYVTLLLCLYVLEAFASELPSRAQLQCPSSYTVETPSQQHITITVTEKKLRACSKPKILKESDTTRRSSLNRDFQTNVVPAFIGGEYKASVRWKFVVSKSSQLKKFLLHFTFHDQRSEKYLGARCFLLRVEGHQNLPGNETVQFHFDCLPLLDEPNIYMSTQVWSYPGPINQTCRVRRSVPARERTCSQSIQCSNRYNFAVSKESHKYFLCAGHRGHHGNPKLSWIYNSERQTANVNITNLPSYLDYAEVDVVNVQTGNPCTYLRIAGGDIKNGSIQIETDKLNFGNYTVIVCERWKIYLKCLDGEYSDFLEFTSQPLQVVEPVTEVSSSKVGKPLSIWYIIGIVGAVVFTGIITAVVFIICHYRHKLQRASNTAAQPKGTEIPELDLQPPNNAPEPTETVMKDSTVLLLYHTSNSTEFERVNRLKFTLAESGIGVLDANSELLHVFPELVHDIVIIFTKQLYIHCHKYKCSEADAIKPLLSEEEFNTTVCEFLEQIEDTINEQKQIPKPGLSNSNHIIVHLVAFQSEDTGVESMIPKFLQDFTFFVPMENFFPYYICGKDMNDKDNQLVISLLVERIKRIISEHVRKKFKEFNTS